MSVNNGYSSHWWSSNWVMAGRQAQAKDAEPECLQPNLLGYTVAGKQYHIDVQEGQYNNLTSLLDAGDYETLNALAHEA